MKQEVEIQRQYYAQTANYYDEMHLEQDREHILALHLIAAYVASNKNSSIL